MRILVVGDGASGVAIGAVLETSVVVPSQPPRTRAAALGCPFAPGPRYVYDVPAGRELLRSIGIRASDTISKTVRPAWYADGANLLASEAPPEMRDRYYAKSRPGEPPKATPASGSGGADAIEVLDVPWGSVIRRASDKVGDSGRREGYLADVLREPDPDVPPAGFDLAIYTCPPSALWPDFEERSLDKVFAPVRLPPVGADSAWDMAWWDYRYRPDGEVGWHRETRAGQRIRGTVGAVPSLVLEWTSYSTSMIKSPRSARLVREGNIAREVVLSGLRPLDAPWTLPGGQILASPEPSPRGRGWIPVGRMALREHGLLTTDAVAAAISAVRG